MAEIVTPVVGEVAQKVAGCLLDPIIRQFGYLLNYRRNITDLNQQIHSLDRKREMVQIDVDAANRQGNEIYSHVQEWLTYAEGIIQNRDNFNEDEKEGSKSCFYFRSRYRLSKRAKKQAEEIEAKINQARDFGDRVSYPPPPPPLLAFINSPSFGDYEAFESRESTFKQIMEALRNEDMRVISVWGMGGVGKTTLVKQIAKQAEEDKLFHKVVMALHISQTPNISEIQGQIARMLGLTFAINEDRAVRLMQCLKKQAKVLVILDDIWEKLELGQIGIPYGDDHKGCKLLLTSRDCRVLDTDMRSEKVFHLRQLNLEESWSLFKKTAGNCVESPDLQPAATNLVKRCDGLPVAIVTVANALKKESAPVWQTALEELNRSAPENIRGVSKNVYSCLELSYNHLEGDEVKSLFLLCGVLWLGDISMDRLLQYAMGLNLFNASYSWEKAAKKLITLVEQLKVSSLLLVNHEGGHKDLSGGLFFDDAFVIRMHDVVRDVARSIASRDPHPFVVIEADELLEWQRTKECRNCSRISLTCSNVDELPQGLVCPQLEFFLILNSRHHDYQDRDLNIPDDFFQDTKQMRVLDLCGASLSPSPSSLGLLSNLQTLCLNQCKLQDVAAIGGLTRLQVLSLAKSDIEQLPVEMRNLSDLRVLDLSYCSSLRVVPGCVLSSLSRLEYLSMKASFEGWKAEGCTSGEGTSQMNACVSELKHLSGLRTLEVRVPNPSLLPEDDVVFENLKNLTRYSIVIGGFWTFFYQFDASRWLSLCGVESLQMIKYFPKLLRRSQILRLDKLKDTKHVVNELDKDGFVELKDLNIRNCPNIQYILDSASAEWSPPRHTFAMLEELQLICLDNLEAVCHGPIPMASFRNLRLLRLAACRRLKYAFSLPENRRELYFPQLQSLSLFCLIKFISFCSAGSNGSQESAALFNLKAVFPALEVLHISYLSEARTLSHHQLPADSFFKLKELLVQSCRKLSNVLPLSLAKALVQLERLTIQICDEVVEAIDATENGDEDEDETTPLVLFPKLTSLVLDQLPQLKRLCSKRFTSGWPLLKTLQVSHCDKVEILFQETCFEDEIDTQIQQPLFLVDKGAFPNLERLSIGGTVEIWRGQFSRMSFSKLREMEISHNNCISVVISAHVLHNLERLEVRECNSMSEIKISSEELVHVETVIPRLTEIHLRDLPNLMHLSSLGLYFQNLQTLEVFGCESLLNLLTLSTAKRLLQLKEFIIEKCNKVKEILVGNDESTEDDAIEIKFTELKSLKLLYLPNLKSFCSATYTFRFPSLEEICVTECPEMEFFCKGVLDTPRLQPEGMPFDLS